MLGKIRKLTKEKGQGLVEYVLIIALVAVIVVGAVKMFGGKIAEWFNTSANKLDTEMKDDK
jgi:Flp pilus assembly pilin Flp